MRTRPPKHAPRDRTRTDRSDGFKTTSLSDGGLLRFMPRFIAPHVATRLHEKLLRGIHWTMPLDGRPHVWTHVARRDLDRDGEPWPVATPECGHVGRFIDLAEVALRPNGEVERFDAALFFHLDWHFARCSLDGLVYGKEHGEYGPTAIVPLGGTRSLAVRNRKSYEQASVELTHGGLLWIDGASPKQWSLEVETADAITPRPREQLIGIALYNTETSDPSHLRGW